MILSIETIRRIPGGRRERTALISYPKQLLVTLSLLAFIFIPAKAVFSSEHPSLQAQPLNVEKEATYLTDRARTFLEDRDGQTAKVWVFFTDKGFSDQDEFDSRASAVKLTDRALTRRSKVGRDKVVFADIAVASQYVAQIEQLGARHRRSSRILNAASFEMPLDRLDHIGNLPFVTEIRPLAGFTGTPRPGDEASTRGIQPPVSLSEETLDYGLSLNQLQQINVPAVHVRGFTGSGVTMAIMDDGFRKSHVAFAPHYAEGRVLAEWDFINSDGNTAIEEGESTLQWSHGTRVWSVAGGASDGNVYGPAYGASYILCKTEDQSSETPVEEDNWVAALEFADSIGTDVINTSLGYTDWYTSADFDGKTAVITLAANTCDGLGIIMCNSAGNDGPGVTSVTPPGDAYDILTVGSVSSTGTIASSSGRGPTYDTGDPNDPARIKPEVCARGVSDRAASYIGDSSYTYGSGTSFATPLVAGVACLVIEAHPDWTPYQVRQAMKLTASRASNPDNTYGWGIVNAEAAIDWDGSGICCEDVVGNVDCSGRIDITDLQLLVDHLYLTLDPLCCVDEGDIDGSGVVDIADLSLMLEQMFVTLGAFQACP
ncbi:MAG: S8 family serine peptidase [bacterium]|nr:S8 family serine peptidase [bacterium]